MVTVLTQTRCREATIEDIPRMVRMGQRFRAESIYASRLHDSPEHMAALGARLIGSADGICYVIDRDGQLTGMIGMLVFAHHFSGERTAGELFFWVEPEHRGQGLRLLKAAEAWARDQRATTIQMIAPTQDVEVLYQRVGYHKLEVAYEKELASCP